MLSLENIRLEIIKYFSEIVVSLDGFAVCEDRVRQYKGHFKTVTENIVALDRERKAVGSALKIKVNTILMRENIEQFEEFCNLLVDLGVDEITFNQLGGFDRPEFFEDNRLQSWQVKELLEKLPTLKEKFSTKGLYYI
jgi:sulfatase maturation enzyme AslB (radical SAM superfamily)